MLLLLTLSMLTVIKLGEASPQELVGAPTEVETLTEAQQAIVDLAFGQLAAGNGCYGQVEKVHNFKQQVVAGTRFTFDLEMGPNQNRTDCPSAPPGAPALQVCHMVVWQKVWENYTEVQWDQVNCTRPGVVLILEAVPEPVGTARQETEAQKTEPQDTENKSQETETEPPRAGAPHGAPVVQEIVDFAFAQLATGDTCRSRIVQVKNFVEQVVAGIIYSFDLELGPAEEATVPVEGCPALASSPSETCHMEVWEKAWENFREVQWDNVNCTAKAVAIKAERTD